jgi:copper chaperone CopZ
MSESLQKHDIQKAKCCCSASSSRAESSTSVSLTETEKSNDTQELLVRGASCGSCKNKIEEALRLVAGVEEVSMNLQTGIVFVKGAVDNRKLITEIERIGYEVLAKPL